MGMAEQMKKKAIKATSATRSSVVVKRIPRCDVVELNRSMEPIINQNERERRAMTEAISKDQSIYRSAEGASNSSIAKSSSEADKGIAKKKTMYKH